jgi:hypothetical protein
MIDFKKRLKNGTIEKKVKPTEIYTSLDRSSITGPLRPVQISILDRWYEEFKGERDLIIKLHTGEGKTLIGLLILLSKINNNEGPCLYICPNIYLVQQVCEEARKFGIPFCTVGRDKELPDNFLLGKEILITHVQKVFNGKSKFGIGNKYEKVGCIVLDDSHSCIDAIRDSFTISISKKDNSDLYMKIFSLFQDDLSEQGEGTLLDIEDGSFESLLAIPYWSWYEKKESILRILSQHRDDLSVSFAWELIKDSIENCQGFITGEKIEIIPYNISISSFKSFALANQRILMSATTQDDSFFIKGLDFSIDAVQNPLINKEQKWSGEKMLLIPSILDDSLDADYIINKFAPPNKYSFGIVAFVPSKKKSNLYKTLGATIAEKDTIFDEINRLKNNTFGTVLVIKNRYDGIDLPDNACRILLMDSLPIFDSLYDRYEEQCRGNSEIINKKIAQKVEQGLGRSVRGIKDFSVILIIGSDLVKFLKSRATNKFFSEQTKKQIEIGLNFAPMSEEDKFGDQPAIKTVYDLINQCLRRDDGWKEYYLEEMNSIPENILDNDVYNILTLEKQAEESYAKRDYDDACSKIQLLIDTYITDDIERGWYLQTLARYRYPVNKTESNRFQVLAFGQNSQLLKPREGITYRKIRYIDDNRMRNIMKWIKSHDDYSELLLDVNNILDSFNFGVSSQKFENAVQQIGLLLGFESQRPDNLIKKGPDNLWCVGNDDYIMLECKSEVNVDRDEIYKVEVGQMNNHCGWFHEVYGDANVVRILIIPSKTVSYSANFTHDVKIMRRNSVKRLKDNIKSFIKEFEKYSLGSVSIETVQELINQNKLDVESLKTLYCENYFKKMK